MKKTTLLSTGFLAVILCVISCKKTENTPPLPIDVHTIDNAAILPTVTHLSDAQTFPGWLLTVYGKNFSALVADNVVSVNGVKAEVNAATDTSLLIVVPKGASAGKVTVTVKGTAATGAQNVTVMHAAVSTVTQLLSLSPGYIQSVATDPADNLYFTDTDNGRVISYSTAGVIKVYQPSEQVNFDINGDGIINAQDRRIILTGEEAIAANSHYIYVTNVDPKTVTGVYRIDVSNNANSGWYSKGADKSKITGPAISTYIWADAIGFDASKQVVLSNHVLTNSYIEKISSTGTVSAFVSTGQFKAAAAGVTTPLIGGLVADLTGNLYMTDIANGRIWKKNATKLSVLAGNANHVAKDGAGILAQFGSPYGITLDKKGNLYVCDNDYTTNTFLIRMINPLGEVFSIAGGAGLLSKDGTGLNARFNSVNSIAINSKGILFVGSDDGKIRKITITN